MPSTRTPPGIPTTDRGGPSNIKPCDKCKVKDNRTKVQCRVCKLLLHSACGNVSENQMADVSSDKWICPTCTVGVQTRHQAQSLTDMQQGKTKTQNTEHSIIAGIQTPLKEPDVTNLISEAILPPGQTPLLQQPLPTTSTVTGNPSSKAGSVSSKSSKERAEIKRLQLEAEHLLQQREFVLEEKRIAAERRYLQRKREIDEMEDLQLEDSIVFNEEPVDTHTSRWVEDNRRVQFEDPQNIPSKSNNPHNFFPRMSTPAPDTQPSTSKGTNQPPEDPSMRFEHVKSHMHPPRRSFSNFPVDLGFSDPFCDPSITINTTGWFKAASASNKRDKYGEMSSNDITKTQVQARMVIPKELPEFKGDPREWPTFISIFTSSTNQCGYSDAENMARLKKALKSEALEAVEQELMFPSALNSVLATLQTLYGQPDIVFDAIKQHLCDTPSVKIDDPKTLITLAMRVKGLVTAMRGAGFTHHLHDLSLLKNIVAKLPMVFRYEWGDYRVTVENQNIPITIEVLDQWLRRKARTACSISIQMPLATSSKVITRTRAQPNKLLGVHKNMEQNVEPVENDASEPPTNEYQQPRCKKCKSPNHSLEKCPDFIALDSENRLLFVRNEKLCRICFGRHYTRRCYRRTCTISGCGQRHNILLHDPQKVNSSPDKPSASVDASKVRHINVHTMSFVYFQVVPVMLKGPEGDGINTYAFLDHGSEISLIEDDLAKQLGLDGRPEILTLKWTGGVVRTEAQSRRVMMTISGFDKSDSFCLRNVRTVSKLDLPLHNIDEKDVRKYQHLSSTNVKNADNVSPRLLIGLDHYQLLIPQETVEGGWDEPAAIRTRLGWSLFGATTQKFDEHVTLHHSELDASIDELIQGYFEFESLGVRVPKRDVESLEDSRARTILESTVVQTADGRYEAGLLFASDDVHLPPSHPMALKRFHSFEKKLSRDPRLRMEVDKQIGEYIAKNYLEIAPDVVQEGRAWYLPIFCVCKPNKTRLVWDAAAYVRGVSLNSKLLKGPDMLANLIGVLFKFRQGKTAVAGDIAEMFHRIKIREQDRDFQRCLIRTHPGGPVETYRMTVMTFGSSCSPATAQYITITHAEKYRDVYPRAVDAIQNRQYVDDYIDSFDTATECQETSLQVTSIHKDAGFQLRNFASNNKGVLRALGQEEIRHEVSVGSQKDAKVLGMCWQTEADLLLYKIDAHDILKTAEKPTKRIVLRAVMRVFDPLGLISFFLVQGKLLLKSIWRSGIKWDDPLQDEDRSYWNEWCDKLPNLQSIRIPRCHFVNGNMTEGWELHVFTDASEHAASALAYFARGFGSTREVSLVSAKTKIGPNRCVTIPRMELQGAVIGARLANTVKTEHTCQIKTIHFWTDSRNVLSWIRSPKMFKVFVAHRVGEIRETTDIGSWRWVPSDSNPADKATKRCRAPNWCPENWFGGPEFLYQCEDDWPQEPTNIDEVNSDSLELKSLTILRFRDDLRPDLQRFSNYNRLLNATARVLRFYYRIKNKGVPIREEIVVAETYLIRSVQLECFGEEFNLLSIGETLPRGSILRQYLPYVDSNKVIRSKSRLEYVKHLSYDQRCPIILPRRHRFTFLLVDSIHREYMHVNHQTVLNKVVQRFVIPGLRAMLKSVRSGCMKCKIAATHPRNPEMASLPLPRMALYMRPFMYTGVDFFGPLLVRIGRRKEKRYGVLFTCLTTRAVHLEIASALSVESFIMVFRMFIGRRGTPDTIYSDNGTNFRGTSAELERIQRDHIREGVADHFQQINWRFNPPSTPHMGGAWERLVRSTKVGLKQILKERVPSEEALRSSLIEIEAMINARPLTYVNTDDGGLESLTPSHFLRLHDGGDIKPISDFTFDASTIRSEWKRQQVVVQGFWDRFVAEYLPHVSQRSKWFDKVQTPRIGDVVAIVEATPYSWQIGRIDDVTKSKDGTVRQVVVRTSKGICRRPSSKIAILVEDDSSLRSVVSSVGGNVSNAMDSHDIQTN